MSSAIPPKGNVQTRAQSRSEGVSDEGRIQNRTLPENYGPKSLEFLPDNFLIDPDNLVRKPRALRKNKLSIDEKTREKEEKTNLIPTISPPTQTAHHHDRRTLSPQPSWSSISSSVPFYAPIDQSPRAKKKPFVRFCASQNLYKSKIQSSLAEISILTIYAVEYENINLLILKEVLLSLEILESEKNLHTPVYEKVNGPVQQKIEVRIEEMELYEQSDEKDYTPFISAPLSSNQHAIFYREYIEPQLISTLESLNINYFFTLTLLNVQTDIELLVTPLVIIYTTSDGVAITKASLDRIWEVNANFSEFLVFITQGTYINAIDQDPPFHLNMYTSRHENWKCGISIGFRDKSATSGAMLENPRNEYAALTCAHLFHPHETKYIGLHVTQPSYEDFCLLYWRAESERQTCERILEIAKTDEDKLLCEANLIRTTRFLQQLEHYDRTSFQNYQKDMEFAMVIKASYEVVDYNGRRCLRDYALLNIFDRIPRPHIRRDDLPEKGYLKEISWENDALRVDELQWDIHVKKRGRTTGVTYGIIAGVHGVMKSSKGGPRREFWALPEALSTSLYAFSDRGDSGSLVWTNDGVAVGIIIAGWTAMFEHPPVQAVILPNRYWDTKNIPFFRNEDGSIDFTGLLLHTVSRPLSLVQSFKMVIDDVGSGYKLWVP